jgi:hypothetical protein
VSCPAGKYALGGGSEVVVPTSGTTGVGKWAVVTSHETTASPQGWTVTAYNVVGGTTAIGLIAHVVCSS